MNITDFLNGFICFIVVLIIGFILFSGYEKNNDENEKNNERFKISRSYIKGFEKKYNMEYSIIISYDEYKQLYNSIVNLSSGNIYESWDRIPYKHSKNHRWWSFIYPHTSVFVICKDWKQIQLEIDAQDYIEEERKNKQKEQYQLELDKKIQELRNNGK